MPDKSVPHVHVIGSYKGSLNLATRDVFVGGTSTLRLDIDYLGERSYLDFSKPNYNALLKILNSKDNSVTGEHLKLSFDNYRLLQKLSIPIKGQVKLPTIESAIDLVASGNDTQSVLEILINDPEASSRIVPDSELFKKHKVKRGVSAQFKNWMNGKVYSGVVKDAWTIVSTHIKDPGIIFRVEFQGQGVQDVPASHMVSVGD